MKGNMKKLVLTLVAGVGVIGAVAAHADGLIYKEPARLYFAGNHALFDKQLQDSNIDSVCQEWMNFGMKYENWPSPGYKTVPGKHWVEKNKDGKTWRLACYMLDRMSSDGSWRDPGAATSAGTLSCRDGQTFLYDMNAQTIGCYIAPIVLP